MAPRVSKGGKAKQGRNEGGAGGQQQQLEEEDAPSTPLANLEKWLGTAEGDCSKLELRELPGNERGVYAKAALEKGEAVFTVPGDVFVSAGGLKAHASGSACLKWASSMLQKAGGSATWPKQQVEILLLGTLLLLERRKSRSICQAYLASLPWDTVKHLPLTWVPELLERRLGGAAPQWEVSAKRKELEKLHGELQKRCKDSSAGAVAEFADACPSSEDLVRAYALVQSRAMSIPTKDSSGVQWEVVLVPFVDMLNHSKDPAVDWDLLPGTPQRIVGRALRPIGAGEELCISYRGMASTLAFFASYGFLEAGPSAEVPPQALQIRREDTIDGRLELDEDVEVMATSTASLRRLLSRLRVALATPEERGNLLEGATSADDAARFPISVKSEVETLTILHDIAQRRLGALDERPAADDDVEASSVLPAAALRRADRTGWERLSVFTTKCLSAAKELGNASEEDAAVLLALEEHRASRHFTGSAASPERRSFSSAKMKLVDSGTAKGRGLFAKSAMAMGTLLLVEEPDIMDGAEDDFMGVVAALMLGHDAKAQPAEGRLRGAQDDFEEDGQAAKDFEAAARWLRGVAGVTAERAKNACAVAMNNGFRSTLSSVVEEDPMLLFQKLSMFNHSCWPNCTLFRDEATGVTSVFTIQDVAAGKELTIHYSDEMILLPTALRRAFMKGRFGFLCECERCTPESPQDFPVEAALTALTEFGHSTSASPAAGMAVDGMRRAHASICSIQYRRSEPAGFAFREFNDWQEALAAAEAAMPGISKFGGPTFWARHHCQSLKCMALEGLERDAAAYMALAEHAAAAVQLLPPRCEGMLDLQQRIERVKKRLPDMLVPRLEAKAMDVHGKALQTLEQYASESRAWLDGASKQMLNGHKILSPPDGKQETPPRYAWPAPVDFVLPQQGKEDLEKAAAIREAAAAKAIGGGARKNKKGKK